MTIAVVVNVLFAGWIAWSATRGGNDCAAKYRAASPYYSVGSNSAPAAIYNSADEIIPRSQAELYARALRAAGVTEKVTIISGSKHAEAYAGTPLPSGKPVYRDTAEFIRQHE